MSVGPIWPPPEALLDAHAVLLARDGGAPGVRDAGGIDAALARAEHLAAYGGETRIPHLAAAIAFGIGRIRHPFVDGNKRVAFAALLMALELNGLALDATEVGAFEAIRDMASGAIDEAAFAAWVDRHVVPQDAGDEVTPA
jgi:death-on-curing protein